MDSKPRKKEKISSETLTPPLEDEDSICSEEEISCPKSCVSEDEENSSC
ncbi:MAG: hypothetical protein PHY77_03325 [Desulfotomaculaceae bacterium]|nr:hypothetical protein [Desulfotomaculaceae bacterium]